MNDHPSRVTGVFLDEQAREGPCFSSTVRTIASPEADFRTLGFSEGDWLGDGELEAVCKAAERLRCIRKAMDCLSYGDMSGKKLLGKLTPRFDKRAGGIGCRAAAQARLCGRRGAERADGHIVLRK